jgi:thiol-disulfide isomerase/thioredoxin
MTPTRTTHRTRTPAGSQWRRLLTLVVFTGLCPANGLETDPAAKLQRPPPNPLAQPSVSIIREPAVRAELRVNPAQAREIEKLLDDTDGPLWRLRDVLSDKSAQQIEEILARIDTELSRILTPAQTRRLSQILLRLHGPMALRDTAVAESLGLTDEQRTRLQLSLDRTQEASKALDQLALAGGSRADLDKLARQLAIRQQRDLNELLTESQRKQWAAMLGRPFDVSRITSVRFKAPELQPGDAWINSGPLSLAQLRGRVVMVNFYAFGCINCIHNYPSYKRWHDSYEPQGLTIIGIHTPETKAEHDLDAVRRKAAENGLAWSILVDNERKNWTAWANAVWPSVYLVDKKGYIRYWWYGELNWEKNKGEALMRSRIEELLAEPPIAASQPSSARRADHP